MIVASIYRPPTNPIDPFLSSLDRCLRCTNQLHDHYTLLAGDFNASNSCWYVEDTTDDAGDSLHQLFSLFGLEQLNHFPTNIYADQLKSRLDLISTDISSVHTRSTEPLGKSDHVAIVGYMQTSLGSDASDSRQIWCWSKANTNDLKDEVNSRNWTDMLDAEDVTIAWQTWKARLGLLEIAKQRIPRRFVKGSSRRRPWMNPTLQQEVCEKHRLFRDYKKSPSPHAWSKFKKQRNKVTSMVRKAKSDFVLALGPGDHQSSGPNNSIPEELQPIPSISHAFISFLVCS